MSEAFCDKFYYGYSDSGTDSDSGTGFEKFLSELKTKIAQIKKNAEQAINGDASKGITGIINAWEKEKTDENKKICKEENPKKERLLKYKLMAARAAHTFSLNVIQDIDSNVGDILAFLTSEKSDPKKLKNICQKVENICDKTNQDLYKTLHPTLHYLSTVLDHQLALAAARSKRVFGL